MIIDVHAHLGPTRYVEFMERVTGQPRKADPYPPRSGFPLAPKSDEPAEIVERLKIMDEAGVQMQVLSNPGGPYLSNEADAAEGARICNDAYGALIRQYPDRFAGYAVLPLPHVQASIRELNRCLDELGMVGAVLACSVQRTRSPVEEEFMPVYEELNRRGCALYFHPSGNGLCSNLLNDYRLTYATGAPMEDTTVVTHLMAHAVPTRFPNITIIGSHFGGALPLLLNRIDHEMPPDVPGLVEAPSVTAKRLYYDTVGHGSPIALRAGIEAFGVDHLLAGSDFGILLCFEDYSGSFRYIKEAGLADEDVDKILSGNAIRLLKLRVTVP